jgi:hypothetical protein
MLALNKKQEKPIFKEQAPSHPIIPVAFAGVSILEAGFADHFWTVLRLVGIIHLVVSAIVLIVALIFLRFTIVVTKTQLVFGFSFFRRKVLLSKIVETRITESTLRTTGLGIHMAEHGYWAWTPKIGRALRITFAAGELAGYIISTDHPRDLIAAIEKAQKSEA